MGILDRISSAPPKPAAQPSAPVDTNAIAEQLRDAMRDVRFNERQQLAYKLKISASEVSRFQGGQAPRHALLPTLAAHFLPHVDVQPKSGALDDLGDDSDVVYL